MYNGLKKRVKTINWHPYTQMKTATNIILIDSGDC